MKEKKNEQRQVLATSLTTCKRAKNNDYVNIYIFIDGRRFELVPHCRTAKETAYFYKLLKDSNLYDCE